MRRLLSLSAVLILFAAPVRAQEALAALQPGARVRIKAVGMQSKRLVGDLVSMTGDSLRVRTEPAGTSVALSRLSLIAVERSIGKQRSLARGAWQGAAVGVGLGILCVVVCPTPEGSGVNMAPAGGLFYGTLAGLAAGAVVRHEGWRQVPLFDSLPGNAGGARR
jgi:hypothetical protein